MDCWDYDFVSIQQRIGELLQQNFSLTQIRQYFNSKLLHLSFSQAAIIDKRFFDVEGEHWAQAFDYPRVGSVVDEGEQQLEVKACGLFVLRLGKYNFIN